MFHFNYAPLPQINESLRGYLERLNSLNGFKSVQYICSMVSLTYMPNATPGSKHYSKEIKRISPAIRQREETLLKIFNRHWLAVYYKYFLLKSHNTVHYYSQNFRYCPMCIHKNAVMLSDWDFPLVTECPFHKIALRETCPHCNQLLHWKSKRLFICSNCEKSIIENRSYDTSAPLLYKLSSDIVLDNDFEYISALILAFRRIFRPIDNVLSMPPLETMNLDEIRRLLFGALGLLHSAIYREHYFLYLKKIKDTYKDISIDACMEAWIIFSEECNFIFDDKYPTLIFKDSFQGDDLLGIIPERLNSKRNQNCDSISHQISGQRLCKLFKISQSSLDEIVNHHLIKPSSYSAKIRNAYFDLNSICKQLNKLEIHTDILPIDEIPLYEVNQYLPLFNVHWGHFIEYLFNKQIHLYCIGKHKQLLNCKVSKSNLLNTFHSIMFKKILPFDSKSIATLLCTNELLLSRLETEKLVFSNHWRRNFELPPGEFCTLMENYICLNRVAFFTSINIYHLEQLLKRLGITIDFNYSHQNSTLKLIAATSENYTAIQNIVKPSVAEQYLGYLINHTHA